MLIERKEKKSKGLFYLIFTLTIIAALTISCKNKPTGTNEFAWVDADIKAPNINEGTAEPPKFEIKTKEDWKTFLGKTLISEEGITTDKLWYFWAEFTTDGIKWGINNSKTTPPANYSATVSLSQDVFTENKANFTGPVISQNLGSQKGNIQFTVDPNDGTIMDVIVTFTDGTSYNYPEKSQTAATPFPIKCGKPKEKD